MPQDPGLRVPLLPGYAGYLGLEMIRDGTPAITRLRARLTLAEMYALVQVVGIRQSGLKVTDLFLRESGHPAVAEK